jgi:anti-anti-sigma factor
MASGSSPELRLVWTDADETGAVVVCPRGELDRETAPRLQSYLASLDGDGATTVVLDLRELTFMDAGGFDALVELGRRARQSSRDAILRRPSVPVQRMLDVLGVPRGVVVCDVRAPRM